MARSRTDFLVNILLKLMALNYNRRKSLNRYLESADGWIDFTAGFRTESGSVERAIGFAGGRVSVYPEIPAGADVTLIFKDDSVVMEMLKITPNEVLNLLLKSKMRAQGNLSYLNLFNFYISLLMGKKHRRMIERQRRKDRAAYSNIPAISDDPSQELRKKRSQRLRGVKRDRGVKLLKDAYLPGLSLEDFPRLKEFVEINFTKKPEVCCERAKLFTDWFVQHGFEKDEGGNDWMPELRQAHAFRHCMENRKPVIRRNDLIAGTTTSKEIGVVIYPDSQGTMIWGELASARHRTLNPYDISDETISTLHHYVFPFWAERNIREWVRSKHGNPLCQQLDERFAVYFLWKTVALSHTIPDFPKLLRLGTGGIMKEIQGEIKKCGRGKKEKRGMLEAMTIVLQGLAAYAKNLSAQAKAEASRETDPARKKELMRLSEICAQVPERPARTLDEAVNAVWIAWVGLHMENTNAGLSLGRLDQWLQPYFLSDMKKLKSAAEKEAYIRHAVELVGCFYMRCTDHLPLIPDIGNYLFGGSSSDQAITLGGVTPDGKDAVNDMTYIFLKVTEMLNIRDPNVNARFHPKKNSAAYLKRLCEVNLITAATPSMHNDEVVMASLAGFRYPAPHLRDWSATGCVEPTISGKHLGHTNCMMMNMVAALEMALNNGRHPLMGWDVGPKTGDPAQFATFDKFYSAFAAQFRFLIDRSVEYNNMLGEAHAYVRPTPLLSSMIDGSIRNGKDVTRGGARYNSSGSACIGLADVTDSLMAIKKLVYDEKKISMKELKDAVDRNFADSPAVRAMVTKSVPFFGSGSGEAVAMSNRVAKFAHDVYWNHRNFRGGRYTAGFWSMSNHVAFGTLAGALPSGRLAGKPFTPGLTPEPNASKNLLDNIRDVAKLHPENLNNNIAFNVKVVPSAKDSHEKAVDTMYNYVSTYFRLGGMQMQMNVVTSAMLRDAMARPENYRNLLVRISGYNAYFVTLNRDMQLELIERAEFGI